MADPVYNGQPTTMLICGDDALAKAAVWQLADELGFEPVDTEHFRLPAIWKAWHCCGFIWRMSAGSGAISPSGCCSG
jgi:hypothetical protein